VFAHSTAQRASLPRPRAVLSSRCLSDPSAAERELCAPSCRVLATMSPTYHVFRHYAPTYHVPRYYVTHVPCATCPYYVTHVPRAPQLCHPCATCLTTMSPMCHVSHYYVTHAPRAPLLCHTRTTCPATMSPMCHVSRYFVPPPTASSGLPPRLSRDNACVGHTWSLPRLHVQRIGHHCKHRAG